MSLGNQVAAMSAQVAIVRQAMELGLWFHTSQEYGGSGGTFQVLRRAFDECPGRRPPIIAKIRCDDAEVLRFDVEDLLRRLDVERVDIVQLCKSKHDRREIVDDLLEDGPRAAACHDLAKRGLARSFCLELFITCSADGTRAIRNSLFDAYIFYWNPIEREIAAETYAALKQSPARVLALRTVCGGLNTPTDLARFSVDKPHYRTDRFETVWPLVVESGCQDVLELSARYLASQPQVLTTIGGTSSAEHMVRYFEAVRDARPLAPEWVAKLDALHDQWAGA